MKITVTSSIESEPGEAWASRFRELWPSYRAWFLSEGEAARPTYLATRRALRTHMPELVTTYDRLVELAGGSDQVARCLGLYRPAPFLAGCSQAVWTRGEPYLIRNYDYAPSLWEKHLSSTCWRGRRVLGMSDCLWGLLDGINDAGLAVSLAFGGSKVVGDGFGVPLIVRYVLETCATTDEAVAALVRLPCHMAYNITVVDEKGHAATVFLGPDHPGVVALRAVATNHQGVVAWPEHAAATRSVERLHVLTTSLEQAAETPERFAARFLEPPLHSQELERGFGTLYTAVYRPRSRTAEFLWPSVRWEHSLDAPGAGTLELELGKTP
jgi:predicted choloylglycine hydrolase